MRILRVVAIVYLIAAVAFILFGYATIIYFDGWRKLAAIASPFNVWNFVAVAVTLAPGLILLHLSERHGIGQQ